MKLTDIFKKAKKDSAPEVVKIDKNKLMSIIGGTDDAIAADTSKVIEKATSGLKDTLKTQV